MSYRPWRVALLLAALIPASACDLLDGDRPSATRTTAPPPSPTPAVTKEEARRALARYAARINAANRRLSVRLAGAALTGSSLRMQTAKYRVFKKNRLRISPYKYTAALSASPKFTSHPRWFFSALTDKGSRPYTRDIVVLVQDRPGAEWRAAYTPLATSPTSGPLARDIDVADFPDVVPADDASLAVPPGRLAGALADVLNRGTRSPDRPALRLTPWIKTRYRNLRTDRDTFRRNGWTGSAAYAPAASPVYAVRTTSGGALVWSAVELKETFRHVRAGNGITWNTDAWGDLLSPFVGRSSVRRSIASVERTEVLAYIPPKGKGQVRFLASRWSPVSVKGR